MHNKNIFTCEVRPHYPASDRKRGVRVCCGDELQHSYCQHFITYNNKPWKQLSRCFVWNQKL